MQVHGNECPPQTDLQGHGENNLIKIVLYVCTVQPAHMGHGYEAIHNILILVSSLDIRSARLFGQFFMEKTADFLTALYSLLHVK